MSTRLDFATLSLMDALDLAVLIENEAYERYKIFAAQLGHRFAGDAASVFASMAENEAKHGKDILERRKALFGDAPMKVSRDDIFDVVSALFAEVHRGRRVRLVGIYSSHFGSDSPQLELFPEDDAPSPADRLRDEVARRFGTGSLTRASLLGRRERRNPSDRPEE